MAEADAATPTASEPPGVARRRAETARAREAMERRRAVLAVAISHARQLLTEATFEGADPINLVATRSVEIGPPECGWFFRALRQLFPPDHVTTRLAPPVGRSTRSSSTLRWSASSTGCRSRPTGRASC